MSQVSIASTTDSEADLIAALRGPSVTPDTATPPAPTPETPPAEEPPPAADAASPTADASEPTVPPAATAPKKRNTLQDRIDEITREKHTAQRERDQERAALERERQERERVQRELDAFRQAQAPAPTPVTPAAPVRPKPAVEDFTTHEEFVEALADWKIEQREPALRAGIERAAAERAEAERQRMVNNAAAQQFAAAVAAHTARWEAVRASDAEFDATLAASALPITPPMRDAILYSEVGPEMAKYFAQHPTEHEQILQLPPGPALVKIGRIEEKVAAAKAASSAAAAVPTTAPARVPPSPAVSRVPPPPATVGAGPAVVAPKLDEADFQTYKREREAQIKAQRGR